MILNAESRIIVEIKKNISNAEVPEVFPLKACSHKISIYCNANNSFAELRTIFLLALQAFHLYN